MPVLCVFMPRRIFLTSVLSVFILVICIFAHRLPFCPSCLVARCVYIFMAVVSIFVPVVCFYVDLFLCPSYILCLFSCHLKFVVFFYAPCLSFPSSLSVSLSFKSYVFLFAYRLSSPSCAFCLLPAVSFYTCDLYFVPRHLLLCPSSGFFGRPLFL